MGFLSHIGILEVVDFVGNEQQVTLDPLKSRVESVFKARYDGLNLHQNFVNPLFDVFIVLLNLGFHRDHLLLAMLL